MDKMSLDLMTKMGISLAEIALKETATAIHGKIKSIKEEKRVEIVRNTYDEIINQLLTERGEAITIARAYKEEFDKVQISDEDIEHLHETVSKILSIIKKVSPNNENISNFEQLKEFISIDTLKTMQLLGFNYKSAIGEPLTNLCANAISNIGKKGNLGKKKIPR